MKTKLHYYSVALLLIIATSAQAQDYGTAIGIRLGSLAGGINVKTNLNTNSAIEGIVGFGHHSYIFTALYEKQHPINSAEGLSWYVGAGAHIGFFDHHGTYWRYKYRGEKYYYAYEDGENAVVPGIDAIIGLEWKIPGAPLLLGIDLKPQIDFHHGASSYFDAAINFRYIL